MTTYAPRHVDIWPWTQVYSGSMTRQNNSGSLGLGRGYSPDTQNSEMVWYVALDSGTWTLTEIGIDGPDCAIQTITLDGVGIGTIDWYDTSATSNIVKQIAGFTVSDPGIYELKTKAATRHASATGWRMYIQLITLTSTGD